MNTRVKAGDSIQFVNNSQAPHTASFGGALVPTAFNYPRAEAPAPGPSPQVLGKSGYFNTGVLPPDAPPGHGPPIPVRSFTFQVPDAGRYQYVCILHVTSGMGAKFTAT